MSLYTHFQLKIFFQRSKNKNKQLTLGVAKPSRDITCIDYGKFQNFYIPDNTKNFTEIMNTEY